MWTCSCGQKNTDRVETCECGAERPTRAESAPRRTRCSCGAELMASGLCSETGGYPLGMTCPFACPMCRQSLSWEGACFSCHGTSTGRREDWTMPGDRYEPVEGHWQRILAGPRRACTVAENKAASALLNAVMARRMGADEALEKLAQLFGPDWPSDSAG